MAIRSFANEVAGRIFRGDCVEGVPLHVQQLALTRMQLLNAAASLNDIAAVPSNQLERMHGHRDGFHCVRVGMVARLCFRWNDGNAFDVELFEYH